MDRFHLMNLRLVDLFHTARILVTPDVLGDGARSPGTWARP